MTDITIDGLRALAMEARNSTIHPSSSSLYAAPAIDLAFVQAMALVQIAQELNEIKHLLIAGVEVRDD